ncbi:bifunctional 3-(3-hydroxy-phenyl)propionate/3-hydroxycinnamic acid hydroxylase [Corticibacterium sp. UT-5YL-CI-8]|nr:bifunctional 3-(3-hydroxy-phenyl)propionate/3-hydroxycinnamic acid hydroxylase [Tianweitania sp. UT-5YL-CI-8]
MQIWDVAIVGCGPVGAFMANVLGQRGLKTIVLDRETAPYALPRAVHIDHEMVRLLASVGLGETMLAQMRAGDGHIHIGADHGMIRYLSVAGSPRPYGYANDYFFFQPELETALRQGLERFSNVELRLGASVDGLVETGDHVQLALSGGDTVRARWVIGCDGARSTVRKLLDIRLDDLDFDEPWLVVDAEVDGKISFPDLWGVPEGANLQNLSLMMCDPQRPATIVPGRGNHRRWEFMLLPGESDAEMAAPERVAALVEPWVEGASHRIIRAATYRFHGLVAEQWRKGRVFVAGDSAHQTPPFFGQGMCHGLRDAANLGWKLALVTEGKADDALLDTYQPEREAQVRHVISAAIGAGKYICELDPERAVERDARVRGETKMRSASELIAPIASAIVGPGAGERFINPALASGGLLDDVTGGGWVLLEAERHDLSADAQSVLDQLGAKRATLGPESLDAHGFLSGWFTQRHVTAALIRPDFYVGTVGSAETIDDRLTALGGAMRLAARVKEMEH